MNCALTDKEREGGKLCRSMSCHPCNSFRRKQHDAKAKYIVYTESTKVNPEPWLSNCLPSSDRHSSFNTFEDIETVLKHLEWDPCAGLDGTWEHEHQVFEAKEIKIKKKIEVEEEEKTITVKKENISYEVDK